MDYQSGILLAEYIKPLSSTDLGVDRDLTIGTSSANHWRLEVATYFQAPRVVTVTEGCCPLVTEIDNPDCNNTAFDGLGITRNRSLCVPISTLSLLSWIAWIVSSLKALFPI